MTAPQRAADPLAYEPGDRLGICLDVDGTVYRSGSVFVETLAYLPYADGVTLTSAERRHRRTALLAVAAYHGGFATRAKWRCVLTGLDALRVVGGNTLFERILATLARREADDARPDAETSPRPRPTPDPETYRSMRRTVLSAYADLLRGKRRRDVQRAVASLVERRCPVDPRLRTVLDRVTRETDAELCLITDAPDHVATAYADELHGDELRVVGTSYETDAEGRYTGRFESVDKGDAVADLRTDREWDFVVAAGDSAVDASMADAANVFLAVAGQGGIEHRLDGRDPISLRGAEYDVRERLGPDRNVVRTPHDEDLASALRTTLSAVGALVKE